MWITVAPLAWLLAVTFTAGWEKIFSPEPRLGFLAQASLLESAVAAGKVAASNLAPTRSQIFNNRLDAAVCAVFLMLVAIVVLDSVRVWYGLLRRTHTVKSSETPFVPSRLEAERI